MAGTRRVAVIGSGFGGSVVACRLAEAGGFDVHVLERGARYPLNGFPRRPAELHDMFWDPEDGYFGQLECRTFRESRMDVITAAGLGGGSLIYSNVLYRAPEEVLARLPGGLTRTALDPYYDRALTVLEATPYPMDAGSPYRRGTPKARALEEAAARIAASPAGHPAMHLEWPHLAIRFGPEPGREVVNAAGVTQTTCTMCGECNIGCNIHAKNTLDLNYLARAEARGARVRVHTEVRAIRPRRGGGWTLTVVDPRRGLAGAHLDGAPAERDENVDLVILAAGSLGSTELALGMRAGAPLSRHVGTRWSGNGDLLGFAVGTRAPVEPLAGPVITGAIRVTLGANADGSPRGAWIEDGGLPAVVVLNLLGPARALRPGAGRLRAGLALLGRAFGFGGRESRIGDDLAPLLFPSGDRERRLLPMLGMGLDAATGRMELEEGAARRSDRLRLVWHAGDGELHHEATRRAMARIAEALGGRLAENPTSGLLRRYISVHPLGGLPLGEDPDTGAVDAATGELFGAPGVHVVDGSILPGAIGPNPSLTIAALAERYAERLCA